MPLSTSKIYKSFQPPSPDEQFQRIRDAFLTLDDLRGRTDVFFSHLRLFRYRLTNLTWQTHTFGKKQHVGRMRNRDGNVCPV
ncbi:hypothetical protein PHMEG_000521 [Phytophthora megakarya]|uniref:Uncharacterized protein n=1 Tax=Phytophthora megakarya TaxID=4795 RepID=A0A225X5E0_9STRA|nr:hypothetical protein PHMEG_000521 [Phytophthora megakarya]